VGESTPPSESVQLSFSQVAAGANFTCAILKDTGREKRERERGGGEKGEEDYDDDTEEEKRDGRMMSDMGETEREREREKERERAMDR